MSPEEHSFVICAYGESDYLEECIVSLINQTVRSNLMITTSTPNGLIFGLAEKYGVKVITGAGKSGIGSDWNFALESADTPLVTIAHQDDVYDPDYSKTMLEYLSGSRDPILFFCGYREIRNGRAAEDQKILKIKRNMLLPLRIKMFWNSRFVRRRILSFGSPICCPSVTYVKDKIKSDKFSESLKCDLDWDLWERLSGDHGAFVYCPKPLMSHRIHAASETTRLIENNIRSKEDLEIFRRFWPDSIARKLERIYSKSQDSNTIATGKVDERCGD